MIRVVMFDLGGTLVAQDPPKVLPGVPDALAAIGKLVTPAGDPVVTCLVSDFHPTEDEFAAAFKQYVDLLKGLKLKKDYEPVARRVTLSGHTAAWKPDRRVFEAALARLGVAAAWGECLLITEDAEHVAAARGIGMQALQFGVDFTDWASAPALVAARVAAAPG